MRCYLVRHAQTIWNGENRIQGHADPPLSPLGHEQAKRLGAYFAALRAADPPIGALYTSGLVRSVQTAQAIAAQTHLVPRIEPDLAEIHLGIWEGLTPEEVDARFDGAYQQWRVAPSQVRIPGAEPLDQFRARVRTAVARILGDPRDGELVIISHGGVIAALLADWLGADYDHLLQRLILDNAGISAVDCLPALSAVMDTRQAGTMPARHEESKAGGSEGQAGRMTPPRVLWVNATPHLANAQLLPSAPPSPLMP